MICGITWTVLPKYWPFLSFLRTSLYILPVVILSVWRELSPGPQNPEDHGTRDESRSFAVGEREGARAAQGEDRGDPVRRVGPRQSRKWEAEGN